MKSNKVVTANNKGIAINYTDTKKHYFIEYDKIYSEVENKRFVKYQDVAVNLNPTQVKMYRLALYGVEALSQQEVDKLSFKDKLQIENKKKSNQLKINRWKQYLTHAKVNSLLIKLFPHSALIQSIVADSDYHCDDLVNKASFKELGINHKSLIDKMIELECLPLNFYAIK